MTLTVAETFGNMQTSFNPTAATGLNKIIQLDLSGEEGGKWAVKIANQACELIPGGVDKPDLTLSMSDQDWIALNERRLNPMNAFATGKIKATGDMMLVMRIPTLFRMQ